MLSGRLLRPVLLVVAHCDDEVIGVGGQLARWGERVTLVHVTDSAPADGVDARAAGFATTGAYASARRRELDEALGLLPRPVASTLALGFPDRGVTDCAVDVALQLRQLVDAVAPRTVLTHAYEGGHPDHDAIAFAVSAVRRMPGAPPFDVIEFAGYHEEVDGAFVTNRFDASLRDAVLLSARERRLKRRMLARFRTQARTLAPFHCGFESLRAAPSADFRQPPPSGRLWYERMPWGITGAAWRASIASAARRLRERGLMC